MMKKDSKGKDVSAFQKLFDSANKLKDDEDINKIATMYADDRCLQSLTLEQDFIEANKEIRDAVIFGYAYALETVYNKVTSEQVDEVYKAYPGKCVVRGASTGKTLKNKDKIRILLKTHKKDKLLYIISRYVRECERDNVYMKNFSTFLNNLPDYEVEQSDTARLCYWTFDGKKQRSAYKDYKDTLESRGTERVKFLNYAD